MGFKLGSSRQSVHCLVSCDTTSTHFFLLHENLPPPIWIKKNPPSHRNWDPGFSHDWLLRRPDWRRCEALPQINFCVSRKYRIILFHLLELLLLLHNYFFSWWSFSFEIFIVHEGGGSHIENFSTLFPSKELRSNRRGAFGSKSIKPYWFFFLEQVIREKDFSAFI